MDITERTPLIHSNSPPTINLRYIPRTWSKLMIITSIIDFIVHLIIYILSYLDKTKNNLTIVNNYLIPLKFYDYLIISSIRVSLLFGFCYVKELIKIHIPIIITLFTFIYIFIDNNFITIHKSIYQILLINSSFIFSWCELIIYVIAIYKYGSNYWYRISNQSFQLLYENINRINQNRGNINSEIEEEEEEEEEEEYQPEDVHIEIDNEENENENSTTINNSFNPKGILQSENSPHLTNKHITIDSNFQFYSFGQTNNIGNKQFQLNTNTLTNDSDEKKKPPFKCKHRVSKSIDIKRKKNDSDLFIEDVQHNSSGKCNTLPNHLSLNSFSPISPFFNELNFFSKDKQSKSSSKSDISNIEKEKEKGKKKYINNQLPIVTFGNFNKENNDNDKKIEENERIQCIINEIEQYYDADLKNLIWGNGIEEAEEQIRSDENYKEKPYLLMALIEIYLIKFVLNGIIDFSYFLKLLKTTEKSVMDVLTKKSQKLYSKSYSMSSLYNLQNSDSMPVSENTSLSSIFSNITSFTNLADYENDEENANVSLNSKDESYYEYLFFKNCEIFYAEVVLIRGFIETVIGKEIRGVIRIRKAWKLYNIFQNENYMNRIGTTEKEQSILSSIKYSVVFGIGFTHIFSFLLNKNELQTINLTPNMDKGINCLGEIIQLNEHKAPISVLLIFVIYVYFNKCKRALKVCQSIREHFPNSIIFTYLFNTTLSIQHTNTKPLFTCDPEKYIRFLGPYFNKKVVNSFLNQKWEDTINNLEEYNKLVKSKNLKLAKNNNYYEHIYIVDKYIRIDNQSLINENKLCIYCLLQPFVIPITNMEQYIYKWCCLKMVLFDYKKDLKIMKDKYKKRNEKELSMPISMNDGTNNEEGIENQNSFNGDINENKNKSENSINNDIKNTSSTNSIDIDKIIESDPVYLAKKEKYEKLKKEFKQFNETFINQCKEYKKSKEISHEKSHLMPDDLPFVMCCQLDPIILYIASNIDNNIDNTSSSSDIFSLIDIVCILFAIHYASPSKMTDLLVKLFPTLNSDSYNTLMNPPLHINTQYIVKCLNSFNK